MSKPGSTPEWLRLQRKIFSRWVNQKLWMSRHIRVEDVVASVQEDPTVLTQLVEVLTDKTFPVKKARSNMRVVKINTANDVLKVIYGEGIQMKIKTSAEDLIDGDEKNVLALVFSILLKFMKIGDDEDGRKQAHKHTNNAHTYSFLTFFLQPNSAPRTLSSCGCRTRPPGTRA